jgi:hypothetical protein
MPNIPTIPPERARGIRSIFCVFQILAVDLKVARPAGALYSYLHLGKSSPLSRLQREMLATVVNGKVGGAP